MIRDASGISSDTPRFSRIQLRRLFLRATKEHGAFSAQRYYANRDPRIKVGADFLRATTACLPRQLHHTVRLVDKELRLTARRLARVKAHKRAGGVRVLQYKADD